MSSSNNPSDASYNPINQLLKKSFRKSLLKEKKIPKNIGPYELKEKITNGSYCKIYLGKSKYTGDKVAIKVINKIYLLEIMEDLLLIKRQLEILKVIKHRNILTLYEIYESPNYIFIVMEYIPGNNLCEILVRKRRFSEEEAKKIFVQLVDALNYLHKMNICHRNITSNHILFDINNIPKLISFTYSTFYEKKQELKDSFGSLCHSCPEIISESPYNPELSDTWSLGTVLYTMVAGYLPFSEENDEKNKDLIVCGKVEYPKEMSNKLKDLLRHMMEPNPKKRYDLNKIMKHPWFKPYNDKLIGGCNYLKMSFPVDNRILDMMQQKFGFDKNKIELDLKNNKYNKGTGLYKLLVKKANILGYHSVSDLGSKEYLEYQKNKKNFFSDGDSKYEKYLQEIQKKMQRIEKIIFGFQEKEENIIKELNNLEESIRNKNNKVNNNNIDNVKEEKKDVREESIKAEKRKSTQRKSPEQKSNIISDINKNVNKKLNKHNSCSIFPNAMNSIAKVNLSLNNKNNNIRNKPRRTHFSNNAESWQDTSIFIKKRKSYLNNSTFFESLLKKSHPDNIRKSEIRKNIISDINQVIIEEKNENNNNNEKKKSLRYSLSFDENDFDESSEESNDNISKIDIRQLSMFDEDGLKLLKDLNMVQSNVLYEIKKQRESKINRENKANQKNKNKKNSAISKFVNLDEDKDIYKNDEFISNEKKEKNEIENIYSTIKSDNNENNEIKKGKVNEQIMEIKEISEIIISSKPKEITVNTVEICSYYNDKKRLAKLSLNNSLTNDFCSIDFIHNKFKEKNIFTYNNDTKKIKKIDIVHDNIIFPIKEVENKNDKEELGIELNTLNLNSSQNSNEEIMTKRNEIKKNTLKLVDEEKNKIDKIKSSSYVLKIKNKYAKSMNSQKNKMQDKIKLWKKSKLKAKKFQSDKCHSKYTEDLSFINISDISEIKPLSILSPTYLNTNIENKENLTTNNNNYNNYIDNKSFQTKSYISNLSMTHENNIFLGNTNTISNTYRFNNYYDYDLNNFYMVHLDNFNKNTYSQNYILNIKKRNLAERLKEEIQKSIDKKQIRSSLLISNGSNGLEIKKSKSKKNRSNKHIKFNSDVCDNNEINFNSTKCMKTNNNNNSNGNSSNCDKNTSRTLKNIVPDYSNFIKLRQKQISNSLGYRNKIKSNGKSKENVKKENKSKSKSKKKEENCYENFIFCNNYCCFNAKHRRDYYENCSTNKKKGNKSTSKRNCDGDKSKNNKKENNIKSNGKKLEISKEKILKEQNNNIFRSYVNIYEKDKKYKLNNEKIKNRKIKKEDKITYLYQNNKNCEYTYRRVLFKFNS